MKGKKNNYDVALDAWQDRMGSAHMQLKNWRFACLFSMLAVIMLSICLLVLSQYKRTLVYVAEVKPGEQVVGVQLVKSSFTPSASIKAAFIGQFVQKVMTLPIDPVMARKQWFDAYAVVSDTAVGQLNEYAQTIEPFKYLGKQTQSVTIQRYHPVGDNSFEVTWLVTRYDLKGQSIAKNAYTGLFTIAQTEPPKQVSEIMRNPLGLKIIYFSFSKEGEGS